MRILINRFLLFLHYLWTAANETHPITLEQLKDHLGASGLPRPISCTP